MKMLMSNAFKVSFLLYETLEAKDNEASACRETLLAMLRETVLHLLVIIIHLYICVKLSLNICYTLHILPQV